MNKKVIALIAHDGKKDEIVAWAVKNKQILKEYELCGTGNTSRRVAEATGLPVKSFLSGPLGCDQQIGAQVAEGKIDAIVFLCDPLTAQPHEPDISALLRLCDVYCIPLATNAATGAIIMDALKSGVFR